MAAPQDRERSRVAERYLVYRDGEIVARAASVVGLSSVLAGEGDGAVSFAGLLEGGPWFRRWVEKGGPGIIEVFENRRQRRVRLHVVAVIDPLSSGETYEAIVERAEVR